MASLSNNNNNTHTTTTLLLHVALVIAFSAHIFPSANSLTTVSISESSNHTLICALTVTTTLLSKQHLNCTSFRGSVPIPINNNRSVSFSETVSGDGFLCGLVNSLSTSTSILACWRFSAIDGSYLTYHQLYRGPSLRELDSGNSHICAIVTATNRLQCWQWNWFRHATSSLPSPARNFSKISVGEDFVCGVSRAGNVTCVGRNTLVVGKEPPGGYTEIASGTSHACAISAADGRLSCWGDIGNFSREWRFVSLASGENRSCGLRADDKKVVCWGQNGFALPVALRDREFVSIEGKRRVFCGVESFNLSLHCWGIDNGNNSNNNNNNASLIFDHVLPGPCRAEPECQCGPLLGGGKYCTSGLMVCKTCSLITLGNSLPPGNSPETLPPSPVPQPPANPRWSRKMVAFLVVGCVGCLCFLSVCGFFLFRYCKGRVCRVHDSGRLEEAGPEAQPGSARRQSGRRQRSGSAVLSKRRLSHLISMWTANTTGAPLEEFPLDVLLDATNNFSEDRKIGAGSFGSVYHGKLADGRDIAVKRAEASAVQPPLPGGTGTGTAAGTATKRQGSDKDRAFLRELEFLSRLHHKNLVRLLGFYEDADERVLVYEYLPNGTLHDHLHRPPEPAPLGTWPARIKVVLDAARGVQYLHDFAVPTIIHRDIKSSNILLDESWTAKVSDFGLSLMGPEDEVSHLSLRAAGTVGYIDPEYFRLQKLTAKSDVYSFGVVLLEILSGRKAIHKSEGGVPRNVVDYVVPYIVQDEIHRVLDRNVPPPTPYEIEAVAYVGYLAADCVALEGRDRPSMAEVVGSLERALAACLARPQLSRSTTESST